MTKRVILLIGHSTGLGFKAAEYLLAQSGAVIYAAAPDVAPMQPLADKGARLLTIDVTDTKSVQAAIDKVLSEQGGLDAVHYNAGHNVSMPVEMVSEADAQLIFDVNVLGLGRVIRAITPHFRKKRAGRFVVTGSVISHFASMGSGWYAATKHALYGLLTAYRQEVMDFGIEVVIIEPGQINTGFEQAAIERLETVETPPDYKPLVRQWIAFTLGRLKKCPTGEKTARLMVEAILTDKPKHIYKTSADAHWVPVVNRWLGPKRADKFFREEFRKADPHAKKKG